MRSSCFLGVHLFLLLILYYKDLGNNSISCCGNELDVTNRELRFTKPWRNKMKGEWTNCEGCVTMSESQLSLKACIFSPCEELESVIQIMTIHDSSDKLGKKEKLWEREWSCFVFMGFKMKEPVACGRSPQPSNALYDWREKGKAAHSTHPLKKKKCVIISVSAYALLPLLDFWRKESQSYFLVALENRRWVAVDGSNWKSEASLRVGLALPDGVRRPLSMYHLLGSKGLGLHSFLLFSAN